MTAYYNENDPFAAAWLRELIKAGHIALGDVDERSIEDVLPSDLVGYSQHHFFAGIGGWSYALRIAGWPDDRPVWTGSCPCQPFSSAGKRGGVADERHLWPAFFHLISESTPRVLFGEQVASKDGLSWFDTVQADLEAADYACWAFDLCAAGVGAPHIRQRLWFVADAASRRKEPTQQSRQLYGFEFSSEADRLAHAAWATRLRAERCGDEGADAGGCGETERLADTSHQRIDWGGDTGQTRRSESSDCIKLGNPNDSGSQGRIVGRNSTDQLPSGTPSLVNGFWHPADWIYCRDEKYRPVEPGTFPLAHGVSNRVGKLRGYGNAIVPQVAAAFIRAYLDVTYPLPDPPIDVPHE